MYDEELELARFLDLYPIPDSLLYNFNNSREVYTKLTEEDIISSISITSKMEFEDDMTLHLTQKILTAFLSDKFIYNSENNVNKRIVNAFKAYNILNDTITERLSLTHILSIHKILMDGIDIKSSGSIRTENVGIYKDNQIIKVFSDPSNILIELKDFISNYNTVISIKGMSNYDKLIRICTVIRQFNEIHPFIDGNGRIGRMLFQKALIMCKLPITTYKDWIREDYHDIMKYVSNTGDVSLLANLYLYNLYNSIIINKDTVNIVDKRNNKHLASTTNRLSIFYSQDINQLIYGEKVMSYAFDETKSVLFKSNEGLFLIGFQCLNDQSLFKDINNGITMKGELIKEI